MKTLEQWLIAYEQQHQHPSNIAIHKIAVPTIVFSLFGLLWSLPVPFAWTKIFNWGIIVAVLVFLYYLFLSIPLALGFLLAIFISSGIVYWIDLSVDISLSLIMISIFIVAWILQFVGHHIEGKRPSFLEDARFLLVGPLWVLLSLYKKFGINIDKLVKKSS